MNLETIINTVGQSVASLQSKKVTKLSLYISQYTRHNNITLKVMLATKNDLSKELLSILLINKQKELYCISLGKWNS